MNTEEKLIKPKLGLLELARQLGNVSQVCKVIGSFWQVQYRIFEIVFTVLNNFNTGVEQALKEISRKKPGDKKQGKSRDRKTGC